MMNEVVHHASTTYQQPSFNRILCRYSTPQYLENLDATSETNYFYGERLETLKGRLSSSCPYAIQVKIGHEAIVKSTVSSPPHPVTFEFREVQNVIANLNPKKAPGIDGISNKMLIELPRVAVRILLFIFNAMLRLEYFPNNWKVAVVKMIPKPGKDLTKAESYRPISITNNVKALRKLLVTKLSPILAEPLFIDVSQAFDKVWHEGLILKLKLHLPTNIVKLLENYITSRKFVVKEDQRLTWKFHIEAKLTQMKLKLAQLHWLIGRNSTLSLDCKLLIYKSLMKPIWFYGVQLWGTASASLVEKIQRWQNKILRLITSAPCSLHAKSQVDSNVATIVSTALASDSTCGSE
ncbi:Probable RNA-directed DNA polymerase from transposon X-element, partial [Eumeta japonica]